MSSAVHNCTHMHGAHIIFRDLTPHLTYLTSTLSNGYGPGIHQTAFHVPRGIDSINRTMRFYPEAEFMIVQLR
jgi:hypothetical protein